MITLTWEELAAIALVSLLVGIGVGILLNTYYAKKERHKAL